MDWDLVAGNPIRLLLTARQCYSDTTPECLCGLVDEGCRRTRIDAHKASRASIMLRGRRMLVNHMRLGLAVGAMSALSIMTLAPMASADYDNYAINGSFVTTSNGEWAQIPVSYTHLTLPTIYSV